MRCQGGTVAKLWGGMGNYEEAIGRYEGAMRELPEDVRLLWESYWDLHVP